MIGKEWSLVAFTLLSEMAVGISVVVWLTYIALRGQVKDVEVSKMCRGALWAVGPVMALSLLVSLLHLSAPLVAYYSINNLRSSWLSREILFALLFLAMWLIAAYLHWRVAGTEGQRLLWTGLTALVGLVTVFCTSMAYLVPTRPAWNDLSTPVSFLATTFLLGALGAGTAFSIFYLVDGKAAEEQTRLVRTALKNVSVIAMAVIVVQAVTLIFQTAYLTGGTVEAQASASMLFGTFGPWYWLRVLVGVVAGCFLTYLAWRRLAGLGEGVTSTVTTLVFAAFACTLVGEIVGRMLFYASVVPVKLPGVL